MTQKTFNIGDVVYVGFYYGGILSPQVKYLPRVVTKVPKGGRKRYQVSNASGALLNRWASELFSKEEVVARRLME